MQSASVFLQEFGFTAEGGNGLSCIEVRRGSTKPRSQKAMRQWPQQVRLEWDRGRVDVAASMIPPLRGRLSTYGGAVRKKDEAAVQEMLIGLVQALEILLAGRSEDLARKQWAEFERGIAEKDERARRRQRTINMIAIAVFVIVIGIVILVAIESASGGR